MLFIVFRTLIAAPQSQRALAVENLIMRPADLCHRAPALRLPECPGDLVPRLPLLHVPPLGLGPNPSSEAQCLPSPAFAGRRETQDTHYAGDNQLLGIDITVDSAVDPLLP
jgi:hypothetical protein